MKLDPSTLSTILTVLGMAIIIGALLYSQYLVDVEAKAEEE